MPAELSDYVVAIAVLFARVGGVFLIAPGLSSVRVPMKVRLLIALGLTYALSPPLIADAAAAVAQRTPAELVRVLATETMIGLFIGLMARLLLMALRTLATAMANMVGLGAIPGFALDSEAPAQAAVSIFTVTAVTIIFITDLHHQLFRALYGSFLVVTPGEGLDVGAALDRVAAQAGETFLIALRLMAPFVIYAVVVNFAVGLTNKLTPQIPVFFVALPAITAGALMMMAYAIREVMFAFEAAFAQILESI